MSAVSIPTVPTAKGKTAAKGKTKTTAEKKQPTKGKTPAPVAKTTTKGKTAAPAAETQDRKYGLDKDKLAELVKGKAYNAYRESSSYWCVVESLHSLGVNKFHAAEKLVAEYIKIADKDALKNFKTKEPRNDNGKQWKDKIVQNAMVVCRAKDYGLKQVQIGYPIRYQRENGNVSFGIFKAK